MLPYGVRRARELRSEGLLAGDGEDVLSDADRVQPVDELPRELQPAG